MGDSHSYLDNLLPKSNHLLYIQQSFIISKQRYVLTYLIITSIKNVNPFLCQAFIISMLSLMNMSSYYNGNIFYLHITYLEDNLPLQNKTKIRYKPNSVDKVASA